MYQGAPPRHTRVTEQNIACPDTGTDDGCVDCTHGSVLFFICFSRVRFRTAAWQNPDSPGERERIEAMGGFVSDPDEPGASARVWLDSTRTLVGLAMARSIGDLAVKRVSLVCERGFIVPRFLLIYEVLRSIFYRKKNAFCVFV